MSEKTDNKVPNVPNLRFSSSILDWELKPITTLIVECSETTSNFEKYPLYSFTIEDGVVPKSERYERSFLVKKDGDSFKVVKYNNFVMNPMNLRFGAISYSKVKNDVSVSGYYNIFNIDNAQCNDYWEALFRRTKTLKLYDSVATGSLLEKKRVHFSQFRNLKFYIPEHTERRKISLFFSKINERIQTQSKIIDKLKSQMNYIIDNIIDYSSPQVQFKDLYTNAGEGGTPSTSNNLYYENGSIPFIKIEDLSNKYLNENKDFITEQGLKNSSAWIIPANSIIYSNGATIGRISINTYPVCTKQGILGIIPSRIVLTEYLYYFLRSIYFRKQVHRITVKGTMDCAYLKDLNFIKCYIPALERQEKIIKSLRCLDEKILLEETILNKLKEQKKFLLSNMFI